MHPNESKSGKSKVKMSRKVVENSKNSVEMTQKRKNKINIFTVLLNAKKSKCLENK